MLEWCDDLKLAGTELYLDSLCRRPRCFVSHAHSDHLTVHDSAISTPETATIAHHRVGEQSITELAYGQSHVEADGTRITLHPAGHVLGSAMLYAERPEGSLLYTGDFKLRESLTVPAAKPVPANVLVMESTYGKPMFRFPPWRQTAAELAERVERAFNDGRQPIVMGYSLGKAQEITRLLTDAGFTATCHGAVDSINRIYEKLGVPLGKFRRYNRDDFHGKYALDLRERGVLVAPPNVARGGFVKQFKNAYTIMMSGWALQSGAIYRYGVDAALPLSDHADFDELLQLIEQVKPKKIYTHHGYREFAETLRGMGMDAKCAKPDEQLSLFS